jgi:hypothetical protein
VAEYTKKRLGWTCPVSRNRRLRNFRKDSVLKKTITYTDFNEEEVSADFFFHLSKAELVELELSHQGGLSTALERIVAAEDGKAIIAEFKNIILGAYGKRSDDGRRFIKNQELRDEFESSEAYSTLFMELVTNTDAAVDFINGVIPAGMAEEAAKLVTKDKPELASVPKPEPEIISRKEIIEMPPEELAEFGKRVQAGEVIISE